MSTAISENKESYPRRVNGNIFAQISIESDVLIFIVDTSNIIIHGLYEDDVVYLFKELIKCIESFPTVHLSKTYILNCKFVTNFIQDLINKIQQLKQQDRHDEALNLFRRCWAIINIMDIKLLLIYMTSTYMHIENNEFILDEEKLHKKKIRIIKALPLLPLAMIGINNLPYSIQNILKDLNEYEEYKIRQLDLLTVPLYTITAPFFDRMIIKIFTWN